MKNVSQIKIRGSKIFAAFKFLIRLFLDLSNLEWNENRKFSLSILCILQIFNTFYIWTQFSWGVECTRCKKSVEYPRPYPKSYKISHTLQNKGIQNKRFQTIVVLLSQYLPSHPLGQVQTGFFLQAAVSHSRQLPPFWQGQLYHWHRYPSHNGLHLQLKWGYNVWSWQPFFGFLFILFYVVKF